MTRNTLFGMLSLLGLMTTAPSAFAICGPDTDYAGGYPKRIYLDQDEDGYGGASSLRSCNLFDGYVEAGGDCNDSNPNINPAALDVPNGVDDDCDGLVDR